MSIPERLGKFIPIKPEGNGDLLRHGMWLFRCSCGRTVTRDWEAASRMCRKPCRCEQLEKTQVMQKWLRKHHDSHTVTEAAVHFSVTTATICAHCRKLGFSMVRRSPKEERENKRRRDEAMFASASLPKFMAVFDPRASLING